MSFPVTEPSFAEPNSTEAIEDVDLQRNAAEAYADLLRALGRAQLRIDVEEQRLASRRVVMVIAAILAIVGAAAFSIDPTRIGAQLGLRTGAVRPIGLALLTLGFGMLAESLYQQATVPLRLRGLRHQTFEASGLLKEYELAIDGEAETRSAGGAGGGGALSPIDSGAETDTTSTRATGFRATQSVLSPPA